MEELVSKVITFAEVINAVKKDDTKKEIAIALIEEIIIAITPPKEEEQQPISNLGNYPTPYPIPTIPNLGYPNSFPMGNTIKLPTFFGDSSMTNSQPSTSKPKKKSK